MSAGISVLSVISSPSVTPDSCVGLSSSFLSTTVVVVSVFSYVVSSSAHEVSVSVSVSSCFVPSGLTVTVTVTVPFVVGSSSVPLPLSSIINVPVAVVLEQQLVAVLDFA